MKKIKITYKNKEYEYDRDISLLDISKDFKSDYKKDIIAGSINNRVVNLSTKLSKSSNIDFYDTTSVIGRKTYLRGLYYLFIKAVKDVLNVDVKIKCFIGNGVYCEILTNNLISEVTVEKIKIRMKEISNSNIPISRIMVSRIESMDYFNNVNQLDKSKSLRFISNSTISLYKLDNTLDYFYGVLPCSTSYIKTFNLKFLGDNKVALLPPILYEEDEKLKYDKNEALLKVVDKNAKFLENISINTSVELNDLVSTGEYGDLIRLSEEHQINNLFKLAHQITSNKDIKMVLITGPTSSGKTTIAKKLSYILRSFGKSPINISVDDFYIDMKDRVKDEEGNPEIERIEAFDTNLFNKKVSGLLDKKEVALPKYDFIEGKKSFDEIHKTKMTDNSILVVEGIHAFNEKLTEIIPDKNKFKVFINPITPLNIDNHNMFKTSDNRLLRRIIRDNKGRGASASKTLEMWKKVRKVEEEVIFPYMEEADVIFNTSLVYELGVLKTYAEPLLFSVPEDDINYDYAIRLINIFRVILAIPSEDVPKDSIIREFIGGSCFK